MEQNVATLPAIKSDEAQHDSNPASAQSTEGKTMRTFTKSHKLDNVLYDVRGPVADEAARMEAAGTHILKLNIGNPAPFGFRTPDEVVYDMAQQLPETEGYSPSKGLFSARKAISSMHSSRIFRTSPSMISSPAMASASSSTCRCPRCWMMATRCWCLRRTILCGPPA